MDTDRFLIDVEYGELKFWVNGDKVTFNICKSIEQPRNLQVILVSDVIHNVVANVMEVYFIGEPLAVDLWNYWTKNIKDYDKVVDSFTGLGSYNKKPLKLDLNLKNWGSPPYGLQ